MEIKHLLRIRVLPDKVFAAITTQKGLSSWWTEESKVNSSELNSILEFSFTGKHPIKMKVTQLKKDELVEWECIEEDGHRKWADTKITFNLKKEDPNTTVLTFTHSGWKDNLDDEEIPNSNYNWGRFLYSLKTYCETGKGFPVVARK